MNRIMAFIYYLFLSFLPAFVGGYITSKNIYPWYGTIKKPDFTPPDYAFSYVWSFIYFSLAISVFLASKKVKENNVNIMKIFYVYIFLNATWSCLFFGLHLIVGGLVLCIMMLVCLVAFIFNMGKISGTAAVLQLPHLAWVIFAFILNYIIYQLN